MRAYLYLLFIVGVFSPVSAQFVDFWMIGEVNNSTDEFVVESSSSEDYPGSATEVDDHFYRSGEYPAPVGIVQNSELNSNFERALTSSDPSVHLHFNLPEGYTKEATRIRLSFRMLWSGTSSEEDLSNVLGIVLNGHEFYQTEEYTSHVDFIIETPANIGTQVGDEMVLSIQRIGGSPQSYTSIDYIKIELNPTGQLDEDGDGLPRYFEQDYHLSDLDPADASTDFDDDQLTAIQEFQLGTDPRNADTDSDGLIDGLEAVNQANPLIADSDGDGLLDGEELNDFSTLPYSDDSDGDSASDSLEIASGFNPIDATDTPPISGSIIGINFSSNFDPVGSVFGSSEASGIIPQSNWNNTSPLFQYVSSNPLPLDTNDIASPVEAVITDNSGGATSVVITGQFLRAHATFNRFNNRVRLLNGFLDTGVGTDTEVTISDIPFLNWDAYVYVAATYLGPRVAVTANGHTVEVRPAADNGVVDYREVSPTASSNPPFANVIRFSGQSGSSLAITSSILAEQGGIAAIQIVDTDADADSDGVPDWYELTHRTGAKTANGDANQDGDLLTLLEEFQAGTDPNSSDSDNDGLLDHVETNTGVFVDSADTGSNPLFADSDGDGISDSREVLGSIVSSPVSGDTDNDGHDDLTERMLGTDSNSGGNSGLPIPTVSTDSIEWEINNVQLILDHSAWSGLEYSGSSRTLFNWRVVNTAGSTARALSIGLHVRNNALTYYFFSAEDGGFGRTDSGSYHISDWNGDSDLTSDLGFSGYGSHDFSDPLTLKLVGDRIGSTSNFNLTWSIVNEATNQVVVNESVEAVAHSSLLDGTFGWETFTNRIPDSSGFEVFTGVQAFHSQTVLEDLPKFAQHKDSDNDGMPDVWEQRFGLQVNVIDSDVDTDNDNLSNIEEYLAGTDPTLADTDGDQINDDVELATVSNPTISNERLTGAELFFLNGDIDGNGFSDAWEVLWNVSSINAGDDSDLDGYTNKQEEEFGTNPFDQSSAPFLSIAPSEDGVRLGYSDLPMKLEMIYTTTDLEEAFEALQLTPEVEGDNWAASVATDFDHQYFRLRAFDIDVDSDGLTLFEEAWIGSSDNSANSIAAAVSVDTNNDGIKDEVLAGDRVAYVQQLQEQGVVTQQTDLFDPGANEASRFLVQASFGPTLESIAKVRDLGIDAWINDQIDNQPMTRHRDFVEMIDADFRGPRVLADYYAHDDNTDFYHDNVIMSAFARAAVKGDDQLRQRVAFALSQIFVVSRRDSSLTNRPRSITNYYDFFVEHAFGNYLELLTSVTYSPIMGTYLSHVGNQPPAPEINRYPDENYAREVMQLFSIGLWELNPDGTRKLNASGDPIPTYSNEEITEMARVLTGFWFAQNSWGTGGWQDSDNILPMEINPAYHDFNQKTLLNGFVIPRRSPSKANADRDVADALRMLFEHPNTPVFIGRQLIQFLVTDNPSPAYVERIHDVFVDNGQGERGDLGAVIKAILTDSEARPATIAEDSAAGRLREPVIRNMHLGRVLNMQKYEDLVWWDWGNFANEAFQLPLYSPSVFNFYRPDYLPPGLLADQGKVGPVFEITNSYSAISFPNRLWNVAVMGFNFGNEYQFPADYSEANVRSRDPDSLIDYVDLVICQGLMSDSTKNIIRDSIEAVPEIDDSGRVRVAIYLALMSPEGSVQR